MWCNEDWLMDGSEEISSTSSGNRLSVCLCFKRKVPSAKSVEKCVFKKTPP